MLFSESGYLVRQPWLWRFESGDAPFRVSHLLGSRTPSFLQGLLPRPGALGTSLTMSMFLDGVESVKV